MGLGTGIAPSGTGIALPATHPVRTTPGTPPLPARLDHAADTAPRGTNMAVGLISVAQLSLDVHFSVFQGMTEV